MKRGDVVITTVKGIKPTEALVKSVWRDKHGPAYLILLTGSGIEEVVREGEFTQKEPSQ